MSEDAVMPLWGYVGKLPAKGDFVQDGLPIDFINQWREWQQAILAVSREQLEDKWQDYYLTAPIWHFALSAGVCGESAMIGTFIPSIDSVGRHFFFTLAAEAEYLPAAYWCQPQWSEDIEPCILDVLEESIDFGQWGEQLKKPTWAAMLPRPEQVTTQYARFPLLDLVLHEEPLSPIQLLDQQLRQHRPHYCVWWTAGSDAVPGCSLITNGLPSISQFSAMLDGQWKQWCAQ
ncbi:type VI secretion system-associated protein TagF [Thaumasiovibrio sp. DFM-14]|uniref:type VI secretion system-associated protein TagF n=1 Tax=Thaumasiovibrio sp. DFM-14 TaxID=3384792 RepID=UPI0039A0F31C